MINKCSQVILFSALWNFAWYKRFLSNKVVYGNTDRGGGKGKSRGRKARPRRISGGETHEEEGGKKRAEERRRKEDQTKVNSIGGIDEEGGKGEGQPDEEWR